MIRKRILASVLGLAGVVALLCVGAIVFLATADLRPMIERRASDAIGRKLAIAELRIGWGNPLTVEAKEVQLANAPWGSAPQMMRIERVAAEIDVWPLLHGVLRYRQLTVVKPTIVLERDAKGVGNWDFNKAQSAISGQIAVLPKDRTQFPTLMDLALSGGMVTYRTSSGQVLRIDLRELAVRSAGDDGPVKLTVNGGYNDTPVRLTVDGQSFAALRDASVPFGVAFSLAAPSTTIAFKGTMTEPLDFEGVEGPIEIDAKKLGELLAVFGGEGKTSFPLSLSSHLHRAGDDWRLRDAKGKLGDNAFTGSLVLKEGGRAQADDARIVLDLDRLDLNPLVDGDKKLSDSKDTASKPVSLRLEAKPSTNVDARVSARLVTYDKLRLTNFSVRSRVAPGQAALSQLKFGFGGGEVDGSAVARTAGRGSRVTARLALTGGDAVQFARAFGADMKEQLVGRFALHATLDMTGETLQQALKTSRGHGVLTVTEGRVARALLEKASADLRALFRENEGWAELICGLGVVDVKNGVGTLSSFRLRTKETSLVAVGTVDLLQDRLDVTVKADKSTTSFLALRIPLRVSGDLDAPNIAPVIGSGPAPSGVALGEDALRGLPGEMRQLAVGNACLN